MIFTVIPETLAGQIDHTYSRAGNRTERSSDIPLVGSQTLTFDSRDLIVNAENAYDANGNTVKDEAGFETGDLYDAENHLIARVNGDLNVSIVYDHDGNRVAKQRVNPGDSSKQVTQYILDDRNPTGYIQVLAEYTTEASTPMVTYAYGLDLISQTASSTTSGTTTSTTHYYGYDGQGSVRMLLDENTIITDTYDFDAYGILLQREVRQNGVLVVQDDPSLPTGTPNHYLYTGEQWDSDLGMYFLRARYYNPKIGRFWTMDSYEGNSEDPQSLHKYLYCQGNPVNHTDASGHFLEGGLLGTLTFVSVEEQQKAFEGAFYGGIQRQMMKSLIFKIGAFAIAGGVIAGNVAMVLDALGPTPQQSSFNQFKYEPYFGQSGTCNRYATLFKQKNPSAVFVGFRLKDNVPSGGIYDLVFPRSGELFKQNQPASKNGFHVGALMNNLVFDNNLLGVPLPLWGEEYEIHRPTIGGSIISVNDAVREGWMEMRIFRNSAVPTTRWDMPPKMQWSQGEVLPPF